MSIKAFFRKHFLLADFLKAAATFVTLVFLFQCLLSNSLAQGFIDSAHSLCGTIASISASMLGFNLTTFAILFSFVDHKKISYLRENVDMDELWSAFHLTFLILGTTTAIAIFGQISGEKMSALRGVLLLAITFFTFWSAFLICRCYSIMLQIAKIISKN